MSWPPPVNNAANVFRFDNPINPEATFRPVNYLTAPPPSYVNSGPPNSAISGQNDPIAYFYPHLLPLTSASNSTQQTSIGASSNSSYPCQPYTRDDSFTTTSVEQLVSTLTHIQTTRVPPRLQLNFPAGDAVEQDSPSPSPPWTKLPGQPTRRRPGSGSGSSESVDLDGKHAPGESDYGRDCRHSSRSAGSASSPKRVKYYESDVHRQLNGGKFLENQSPGFSSAFYSRSASPHTPQLPSVSPEDCLGRPFSFGLSSALPATRLTWTPSLLSRSNSLSDPAMIGDGRGNELADVFPGANVSSSVENEPDDGFETCRLCEAPTRIKKECANEHLLLEHGESVFICTLCDDVYEDGTKFERFQDIVKHVREVHSVKPMEQIQSVIKIPFVQYLRQYQCTFCLQIFVATTEEVLTRGHFLTAHNTKKVKPTQLKRICRICDYDLSKSDVDLIRHIGETHPRHLFGNDDEENGDPDVHNGCDIVEETQKTTLTSLSEAFAKPDRKALLVVRNDIFESLPQPSSPPINLIESSTDSRKSGTSDDGEDQSRRKKRKKEEKVKKKKEKKKKEKKNKKEDRKEGEKVKKKIEEKKKREEIQKGTKGEKSAKNIIPAISEPVKECMTDAVQAIHRPHLSKTRKVEVVDKVAASQDTVRGHLSEGELLDSDSSASQYSVSLKITPQFTTKDVDTKSVLNKGPNKYITKLSPLDETSRTRHFSEISSSSSSRAFLDEYFCDPCQLRVNEDNVKLHMASKKHRANIKGKFRCMICSKYVKELSTHLEDKHAHDLFQCNSDKCSNPMSVDFTKMLRHLTNEHYCKAEMLKKSLSDVLNDLIIPENLANYNCKICNRQFLCQKIEDVLQHQKWEDGAKDPKESGLFLFCRICGNKETFATNEELQRHCNDHNDRRNGRRRSGESRRERSVSSLSSRSSIHQQSTITYVPCIFCNRMVENDKTHQSQHHPHMMFSCIRCSSTGNYQCASRFDMIEHLKIYHHITTTSDENLVKEEMNVPKDIRRIFCVACDRKQNKKIEFEWCCRKLPDVHKLLLQHRQEHHPKEENLADIFRLGCRACDSTFGFAAMKGAWTMHTILGDCSKAILSNSKLKRSLASTSPSPNRPKSAAPLKSRSPSPHRNITSSNPKQVGRSSKENKQQLSPREDRKAPSPCPNKMVKSPRQNSRSPSPRRDRRSSSRQNKRSPSPRKRRSQSPRQNRRSSSSRSRRSQSPRRNRRSQSPRRNRRSLSPRQNRRSPSPRLKRRSPSPRQNRRSASPRQGRRSPSPKSPHQLCCYCRENFAQGESAKAHIKDKHFAQSFQCLMCPKDDPKLFESRDCVFRHFRNDHANDPRNRLGTRGDYVKKPTDLRCMYCYLCLNHFYAVGVEEMKDHFSKSHADSTFDIGHLDYKCRLCMKGGAHDDEEELMEHLKEQHGVGRRPDKDDEVREEVDRYIKSIREQGAKP